MQGVLTSREAWVRFATALFVETELTPEEIGIECDQMLIEYLRRFPDPESAKSAILVPEGDQEFLEFEPEAPEPQLTAPTADPGSSPEETP